MKLKEAIKKAEESIEETLACCDFPSEHWARIHINNARIFIQGVNLLTFSKFKLWDVELGDGRGAKYPNIGSVSLGINFNF